MGFAPARLFDPRDYGTVDPTGTVSSRAAIQAALDACAAAGGGVVEIPFGTFLLSNTLTISASNVTLRGQGRGSLLTIAAAVSSLHVIAVTGTSGTPIKGVTIENLRWQGYGDDAGVTATSHGLYVRWCDQLKVQNVWAHDCTFAAIRVDDSEHAIITGVHVEAGTRGKNGGWYGVELGNFTKGQGARGYSGHHVLTAITTHVPEHSLAVYLCDDVSIEGVTATGGQNDYTFNWTGSQRVVLTNFTIKTNGGGYLYGEWDSTLGTSRGCQYLKFAHGTCTGLVNAPDESQGGSPTPTPSDLNGCYFTTSPDVIIQDVLLDCSGQTAIASALHGISADSNSPRLRLVDVTILSPLGDGVKLVADDNSLHRVRVTSPRGSSSTANAGINITAGLRTVVQACRVDAGASHGIYSNSANSLILDNIITSCAGDGIRIVGADVRVAGNHSVGNTLFGFSVQSTGSRCRLAGNFAQTNTGGNYTATTATGLIVGRDNKGLTDVAARTSSRTLGQLDYIEVFDASGAARVPTLPAANAVPNGREYIVKSKSTSTNNVTVTAAGSDLIDGSATLVLTAGQTARLRSDGTSAWYAA